MLRATFRLFYEDKNEEVMKMVRNSDVLRHASWPSE